MSFPMRLHVGSLYFIEQVKKKFFSTKIGRIPGKAIIVCAWGAGVVDLEKKSDAADKSHIFESLKLNDNDS